MSSVFLGWKDEVSKEMYDDKIGRGTLNMCHLDASSSYLWLDHPRLEGSVVPKKQDGKSDD